MTRRVIVGRRQAGGGVWVSKPGVDALTADLNGLMLSTERNAFQIVASGIIQSPANNADYDFAIPNLGFTPLVLVSGSFAAAFSFPSATTLRIRVQTKGPRVIGNNFVGWAVTNQRIWH